MLGRRWINNQRKSNSVWYNTVTPHWKIIALICCARRSPKVTLITVFVSFVEWKQARWPPLFITFLISLCLVTTAYQVSSEFYGGFFYSGIALSVSTTFVAHCSLVNYGDKQTMTETATTASPSERFNEQNFGWARSFKSLYNTLGHVLPNINVKCPRFWSWRRRYLFTLNKLLDRQVYRTDVSNYEIRWQNQNFASRGFPCRLEGS